MEVWTLSVETDAAVFMGVLYGNIIAIATLIRPNGAHTKNFYTQLMSARRLVCRSGKRHNEVILVLGTQRHFLLWGGRSLHGSPLPSPRARPRASVCLRL